MTCLKSEQLQKNRKGQEEMPISSPNPKFDLFFESSHRDDSNKWLHIGIGEEIGIIEKKIRTLSGALSFNYFESDPSY